MRNPIYLKLAWQSIRKNYRITMPFLAGSLLMTTMLYSISSLQRSPDILSAYGGNILVMMLQFGQSIMVFFCGIFFLYLNGVLMKHRKQENGLYTVLGMEKHHLVRILLYQMVIYYALSIVIGIPLGIIMDKVMSLLVMKLIGGTPPMGFRVDPDSIALTCMAIALYFALIFAVSVWQTVMTNPLDLLKGGKQGEKPIHSRWILAVLGLICLGSGYYLSLTTKDPIQAFMFFFIAVLLVIAGTYLLFLFGSVTIVNTLQKNKKYYYTPNHFISISLMKYRMKQNATSLANIAILSTMILVALSTSVTLVTAVNEAIAKMYPREYNISSLNGVVDSSVENRPDGNARLAQLEQVITSAGLLPENVVSYSTVENAGSLPSGTFSYIAVTAEDWNKITGDNVSVAPGEVLISYDKAHEGETLETDDHSYLIRSLLDQAPNDLTSVYPGNFLIDGGVIVLNSQDFMNQPGLYASTIHFDLPADGVNPTEKELADMLQSAFADSGISSAVSKRSEEKEAVLSMYSGALFIGIYVSLMFAMAVILIMYYKQISEGMDDQKRFVILQNIGLEERQIRKIINGQVLVMFFLPLGTAAIHIAFAYPMIDRIIKVMGYTSSNIFFLVSVTCFAIFALLYIVIYKLTARTYYRLTCVQ